MLRVACTLVALLGSATIAMAQAPASGTSATRQASTIRNGTYDLQIAFGGGILDGTLVIRTIGDSMDVSLKVGDHDSPVRPGHRQGSQLVLEGTGGMQVRYQLEFKGDDVSGSFTYDGQSGSVTGKRKQSSGS